MKLGFAACGLATAVFFGAAFPASAQPNPFTQDNQTASSVELVVGYQCGPNRHWSSKMGRCVLNRGAGGGTSGKTKTKM